MTALLDTGFLYALADADDRLHGKVRQVADTIDDTLLLPIPVLPEVAYLIGSRLGHAAMRRFLGDLSRFDVQLVPIDQDDLKRIVEILDKYADVRLDFVDASIIALAERLDIRRILTVDHRDFSIVRPRHCDYFELLPHQV